MIAKISDERDLAQKLEIFKQKTGKSFDSYFETYLPKLEYYNSKIMVNDFEAGRDLAVEAMFKAISKIEDFDADKASFTTWLYTISKNECILYLKKEKSKKTHSSDKIVDEDGTRISDFMDDGAIEEDELRYFTELDIQKGSIIRDNIDKLPEPYREVIYLREIMENSYINVSIHFRKLGSRTVSQDFFTKTKDTDGVTNKVKLYDIEHIKGDTKLVKFFTIDNIYDVYGNEIYFEVTKLDKDGLIEEIVIPNGFGNYEICGEIPLHMSNLKNYIRKGRQLLRDMVEEEFLAMDRYYI